MRPYRDERGEGAAACQERLFDRAARCVLANHTGDPRPVGGAMVAIVPHSTGACADNVNGSEPRTGDVSGLRITVVGSPVDRVSSSVTEMRWRPYKGEGYSTTVILSPDASA